MNWREQYRRKIVSASEAVQCIQSGMRVYIHPGCAEPEALVEALRSTNLKQEIAAGGPVQFTPNGDNMGANTALMQVQKGEVKVVLPKEIAQADYVFPTPPLWKR